MIRMLKYSICLLNFKSCFLDIIYKLETFSDILILQDFSDIIENMKTPIYKEMIYQTPDTTSMETGVGSHKDLDDSVSKEYMKVFREKKHKFAKGTNTFCNIL